MEEQSHYQTNSNLPKALDQARQLLAQGKIEESMALVKSYWLENPEDAEAASLFSELMKESGRSELSRRLNSLAEQLPPAPLRVNESSLPFDNKIPELPPDILPIKAGGKELFEAGYSLIDARQHELAAMLLNRAADIAPKDPTVNYELGFALMSLKHFDQAIPHLEHALEQAADFDTLLNLIVCYTLTRQLEKAHQMLKQINELTLDTEQKQEVSARVLVVKRLESLRHRPTLNSRDWLYVLYGSILLRPTVRQDSTKEDTHSIGQMLAILKGVLEGLSAVPEVIESYGVQSRPLAQALAEFLEIPISNYKGPEQPAQALLVMTWASDIIGPHKTFTTKQRTRSLFSYGLTWDDALPVMPEIVGMLAHHEPMPWNEVDSKTPARATHLTDQPNFTAEVRKAYKAILANAREVESDPRVIKNVQEALDYYETKKHHLVLCQPEAFACRPEYTAEVID